MSKTFHLHSPTDCVAAMAAQISLAVYFVAGIFGSLFLFLSQIDASLWEKSAWVIMCTLFLAGLGVLWRVNQKLIESREKDYLEEIKWLRAANERMANELKASEYRHDRDKP